jgi:hypothetical protein
MRFGEHSINYLSELHHSPFLNHDFVSDIYDPLCMSLTVWNFCMVRHLFRLPITTQIRLTKSHWFLCLLDEPMRFGVSSELINLSTDHVPLVLTMFLSATPSNTILVLELLYLLEAYPACQSPRKPDLIDLG